MLTRRRSPLRPSVRSSLVALLAVLGLILAACPAEDVDDSPGQADPPPVEDDDVDDDVDEFQALVEAAQAEGQLTFYGSQAEPIVVAVAEAFQEEYGITVNHLRMVTSDLQTRYASELEAGAPTADAIIIAHGDPFMQDMIDEGYMVDVADVDIPGIEDFPRELFEAGAAIVGAETHGIAYNTDLVSEDEVPTDWADLADPRWQGEILLIDPASSPGHTLSWIILWDEYGEDFIRAVADNAVRMSPGMIPNFEALAAGEGSIGVTSLASVALPLAEEGAPVAHVVPDLAPVLQHSLGLTAEPQNPNAARLFAHFVMVGEGQQIMNDPVRFGRASPVTGENMPERPVPHDRDEMVRADELFDMMGTTR